MGKSARDVLATNTSTRKPYQAAWRVALHNRLCVTIPPLSMANKAILSRAMEGFDKRGMSHDDKIDVINYVVSEWDYLRMTMGKDKKRLENEPSIKQFLFFLDDFITLWQADDAGSGNNDSGVVSAGDVF